MEKLKMILTSPRAALRWAEEQVAQHEGELIAVEAEVEAELAHLLVAKGEARYVDEADEATKEAARIAARVPLVANDVAAEVDKVETAVQADEAETAAAPAPDAQATAPAPESPESK